MGRSLRIVLMLATMAGCASPQKKTEDFLDDVRLYQEGLRWRRYDDAAARRLPAEREDFLDEREELDEDLRIDDYEIERVKFGQKRSMAVIQVKFVWHLDSVGSVHETVVEQAWEMRGKSWLLIAEARKRGKPMPGVPEREKRGKRDRGSDDGDDGDDGDDEHDGDGDGDPGSDIGRDSEGNEDGAEAPSDGAAALAE